LTDIKKRMSRDDAKVKNSKFAKLEELTMKKEANILRKND